MDHIFSFHREKWEEKEKYAAERCAGGGGIEIKHCATEDVEAGVVPMLMKIASAIVKFHQQTAHENAITSFKVKRSLMMFLMSWNCTNMNFQCIDMNSKYKVAFASVLSMRDIQTLQVVEYGRV